MDCRYNSQRPIAKGPLILWGSQKVTVMEVIMGLELPRAQESSRQASIFSQFLPDSSCHSCQWEAGIITAMVVAEEERIPVVLVSDNSYREEAASIAQDTRHTSCL